MRALHVAYYNFCRIHRMIRVTPAMEAGITDRVWEVVELLTLQIRYFNKATQVLVVPMKIPHKV